MQTTPTGNPLDVATFAKPVQQRRFATAMDRLAADRAPGTPVRVYVSASPRTMNGPKWGAWLAQIAEELPDGVEILHYRNTVTDDCPYDWDSLAERLDGLVVVGKQKRAGSRVYLLGPIARLELRSVIARRPVLLFGHSLGLIPVIDCKSQVLPPEETPRLKLIAPKRWQKDSETLRAALNTLTPRDSETKLPQPPLATDHLVQPFATTATRP
ncbi:hypothetical protein ABZ769_28195 [Streptomyces olivoreticuli]